MLAGIAAELLQRLEQGRDRNPSMQVLQAVARVLRLDDDAYVLGRAAGLDREKLEVSGADGLMLVVYHAEAAPESAECLGLLGSITPPTARRADRQSSSVR
jgi:transcriptional regulator with XRE-family HTH domain